MSPRFPPTNAADMHRVRQSLPYFREFGWDPAVLAVAPEYCEAPEDPWLMQTVPDDVPVVRTRAVPLSLTRRIGLGNLDLRALPFIARRGTTMLREAQSRGEPFHLVYFSTTVMSVTALGRYWRYRFGIPYVLDLHDPWFSTYYDRPGAPSPPGGRVKYGLANSLARMLEPMTLRKAAHVISVSEAYPETLTERYPDLDADRFTVLPFGAPERDFEVLRQQPAEQSVFNAKDGRRHWMYVGRAGADMRFSLTALFTALRQAREAHPKAVEDLRLHFVGTDYAAGDRARKSVAPVAEACGVGDLVEERPHRIPYAEALQSLLDADALLMPGSDDPGYTASKLYPYILARKPLLALFHADSSVVEILRSTGAGEVVSFQNHEPEEVVAKRVTQIWFANGVHRQTPETDWDAFAPYTAREMTRRQSEIFDRALCTSMS